MLTFTGDGSTRTCDGVTRRDFLRVGTLGAIGFTLPQLFALKARGSVEKDKDERSCIMIFNLGAPSQLDLFDPKPNAPEEIRGPFKAIRTASPDIQLTELLPLHAKIADKFSLVRSVYHTAAAVPARRPKARCEIAANAAVASTVEIASRSRTPKSAPSAPESAE